ncbi:MAG: thioredoxin domain-containing protein, partial [Nitrospirae bacterium]
MATEHPTQPANRLAREVSPYLLQHAHNPVDWYPWGEEALARARAEGRPILLSIGYAACHWCHVMAHESFEDPATAAFMNDHFVCIKVDREERPDLDQIYQTAHQLMTGRAGGWPLTVFLTPEGRPFFAGTYFPPEDRHGLPSFRRVLAAVARHYEEARERAEEDAGRVVAALAQVEGAAPGRLDAGLVAGAAEGIAAYVDPVHGGLGQAPKFPQTACLTVMLRAGGGPRELALLTLRRMAAGGIHDHLGGGFARYSTDAEWLVPHFEKMLYDNALLAGLYLEAHQATGEAAFAGVVRGILGYLERHLYREGGGFYASQDADSEGEEGRYYVWRREEIEALLGEEAEPFCRCYGVTAAGNWEGKTILHRARPTAEVAAELGMAVAELEALLARGRERLRAARARRTPPATDTKVIVSWNGMALSACARAGAALGLERPLAMAAETADLLWSGCWEAGRLRRCWHERGAYGEGLLDDYAYLGLGLLDLYEVTGEGRHLARALELAAAITRRFPAAGGRGLHLTPEGGEGLVHRPRSSNDHSIPSGASAACTLLLRLAPFAGDPEFERLAAATLEAHAGAMAEQPVGYAGLITAVPLLLDGPVEVTLVGEAEIRRDWARRLARLHLPHRALCHLPSEPPVTGPIAEGKEPRGRAAAYLCHHRTCSAPLESWEALAAALAALGEAG